MSTFIINPQLQSYKNWYYVEARKAVGGVGWFGICLPTSLARARKILEQDANVLQAQAARVCQSHQAEK